MLERNRNAPILSLQISVSHQGMQHEKSGANSEPYTGQDVSTSQIKTESITTITNGEQVNDRTDANEMIDDSGENTGERVTAGQLHQTTMEDVQLQETLKDSVCMPVCTPIFIFQESFISFQQGHSSGKQYNSACTLLQAITAISKLPTPCLK